MNRWGTIYSSYWEWALERRLSDDATMLGAYLPTCKHANSVGAFRLPPGYVSADRGWTEKRFRAALVELADSRFLFALPGDWVVIRDWLQWNPPKNPNQASGISAVFNQLPRSVAPCAAWCLVNSAAIGRLERHANAFVGELRNIAADPNCSETVDQRFANGHEIRLRSDSDSDSELTQKKKIPNAPTHTAEQAQVKTSDPAPAKPGSPGLFPDGVGEVSEPDPIEDAVQCVYRHWRDVWHPTAPLTLSRPKTPRRGQTAKPHAHSAIADRLRDGASPDYIKRAIDRIHRRGHNLGDTDGRTHLGLELICRNGEKLRDYHDTPERGMLPVDAARARLGLPPLQKPKQPQPTPRQNPASPQRMANLPPGFDEELDELKRLLDQERADDAKRELKRAEDHARWQSEVDARIAAREAGKEPA